MEKNWLSVVNESGKTAKIKIHGVIGGGFFEDGVTSQQVDADLEEIKALKAETIIVDLESGGGSVLHGIKIYNLLKENPAKIKIKGTGIVASIATVIAAAAADGEFSMVNNSFYLIHEGRTSSGGTKSQINRDVDMLGKMNDTIAEIYSNEFNITKKEALAIMSINDGEGEFLTANEAKEKGFVDSTYTPSNGAIASITQEELDKYKIKVKINLKNNNMKFNLESIKKNVKGAYDAFRNALSSEEKKDEKNNEAAIAKAVEVVVESLQEQVDTYKTEMEGKVTALESENTRLKAVAVGGRGDDANLGDNKKKTKADLAAEQFIGQLSEADKLRMTLEQEVNK